MKRSYVIMGMGMATIAILVGLGQAESGRPSNGGERPAPLDFSEEPLPDTRKPLDLAPPAGREHRTVMLQHLETVQAIVAALAEEDYELAKGLTDMHLGFFMHRQAMARQKAEDFPPAYHDLAMAHHEAAEELARTIPSRNLKQILPKLDHVLKTCVNCHLSYRVPAQ
jgi:hypothetical protein